MLGATGEHRRSVAAVYRLGLTGEPGVAVPRLLEAGHGQRLDEVSHVQAARGRVETAIQGDRTIGECLAQCVKVGRLREQAAPLEFVDDVGHCSALCRRDGPGRAGSALSVGRTPETGRPPVHRFTLSAPA